MHAHSKEIVANNKVMHALDKAIVSYIKEINASTKEIDTNSKAINTNTQEIDASWLEIASVGNAAFWYLLFLRLFISPTLPNLFLILHDVRQGR